MSIYEQLKIYDTLQYYLEIIPGKLPKRTRDQF